MLQYERTDMSEGNDFGKTNKSVEYIELPLLVF